MAGAFANLEPGGRGSGLAGALGPLVDDPTAIHWNPSRLVLVEQRAIAATYADLFGLGLARHTALFLAFPRQARDMGWADGRLRASPGRVNSAYGIGVQATLVDFDPSSYAEYDLSLTHARRGALGLVWGLTGHGLLVRSDLTDVSASGFSADLAVGRSLGRGMEASLIARSLFSTLAWDGGARENLHPTTQLGLLFRPHRGLAVPVAATYDLEASALNEAALGVEWQAVGETLLLRAGARWRDDGVEADLRGAAGAGLRWNGLGFDYGLTMGPEDLGETHRLSLLLHM
ncbi:MAG: hypothetical protein V1774_10275 [Candidatus Eisenbacteria bacterium]